MVAVPWNRQRSMTNLSQATSRRTAARSVSCGPLGKHRPSVEIDDLKTLLDVQRPRLAAGPDSIPVEQAKSRVAGLLDLGDHEPRPQRVDCPRGDEHAVARLRVRNDADSNRPLRPSRPGWKDSRSTPGFKPA